MNAEYLRSLLKGCYEVSKVVTGSVESLKPHLIKALPVFGYQVLDNENLSAYREGRKEAAWDTSASILDHPVSLRIELQPVNDDEVLLIFSYIVKRVAGLTRRDRQTLEFEADLLIGSLADSPAAVKNCARCGVALHANSRFCRWCGVSVRGIEAKDTLEIKYLNLIAQVRSGNRAILEGVGIFLLILTVSFLCLYWNSRALPFVLVLLAVGGGVGCLIAVQGMRRLHSALQPPERVQPAQQLQPEQPPSLPDQPTFSEPSSVTERTTDLLN